MKVAIHHVGGRHGTIPPISPWKTFFPAFDVTLYDADLAVAEFVSRYDLRSMYGYASVDILPHCLGSDDGVSDFYLCFDRSASSMLPFDPAFSDYSQFMSVFRRGVYNLGEANQSEAIKVDVRSLRSLIAEGKISVPDFLSIDAEGAGLQILKGLGEKHLEDVLGIVIETSLIPIHKGEKHFHETLKFVTEQDFLCVDLGGLSRASVNEMHLSAFDRGVIQVVADAVFLKNPAKVRSAEALGKLALLSLLYGITSVTYECFKKLEQSGQPLAWQEPGDNIALNCLRDFYKTFCAYKDFRLPKITETHNAEIYNYKHYAAGEPSQEQRDKLLAHLQETMPKYVDVLMEYRELRKNVPTHDALYAKYALPELAEKARAGRILQEEFLINTLVDFGLVKKVATGGEKDTTPPQ